MSLHENFRPFLLSSVLAAHASSTEQKGFRQKDVKYYLEVFTNWIETLLPSSSLEIQNTQIGRFLEKLVKSENLKKTSSEGGPHYQVTRLGLHEIINDLITSDIRPVAGGLGTFLFLYHFVDSYSHNIEALLGQDLLSTSPTYQIEIKHLLNSENLLKRQKDHVLTEIEKLEWRIEEAHKASKLAKNLFKQNQSIENIVEQVQKNYPYELNNLKPMVELYRGLPNEMRRFELEEAPIKRADTLWLPLLNLYKSYQKELDKLS